MERAPNKHRAEPAATAAAEGRTAHDRLELLAIVEGEAKADARRKLWDSIDREVVALVRRLLRVKGRSSNE